MRLALVRVAAHGIFNCAVQRLTSDRSREHENPAPVSEAANGRVRSPSVESQAAIRRSGLRFADPRWHAQSGQLTRNQPRGDRQVQLEHLGQ